MRAHGRNQRCASRLHAKALLIREDIKRALHAKIQFKIRVPMLLKGRHMPEADIIRLLARLDFLVKQDLFPPDSKNCLNMSNEKMLSEKTV